MNNIQYDLKNMSIPVQIIIMTFMSNNKNKYYTAAQIAQIHITILNKSLADFNKSYNVYIHYLVHQQYLTIKIHKNIKYFKYNKALPTHNYIIQNQKLFNSLTLNEFKELLNAEINNLSANEFIQMYNYNIFMYNHYKNTKN